MNIQDAISIFTAIVSVMIRQSVDLIGHVKMSCGDN